MYNNGKPNQPPYLISAYGIWLRQGNSGTEEDFINSLKGDPGDKPLLRFDAETGYLQDRYDETSEWENLASLEALMTEGEAAVIAAAKEYSDLAEAYAKGTVDGDDVSSGDPGYQDNAKYYAGQAQTSAEAADDSADAAAASAADAGDSATSASGYADSASNSKDAAISARNGAVSSAQIAAAAAGQASTSAQAAADSASGAATSAYNADQAAQSAANYASAANSSVGVIAAIANGINVKVEDIQTSVSIAAGYASDAETAQGKAEDAQEAAETAQGKAEDAQEAAETAQGKAEDAQEAAEAAAATLEIDDTLTHSGQAADAKATGDAVADLKSAIIPVNFLNTNLLTSGADLHQLPVGIYYTNSSELASSILNKPAAVSSAFRVIIYNISAETRRGMMLWTTNRHIWFTSEGANGYYDWLELASTSAIDTAITTAITAVEAEITDINANINALTAGNKARNDVQDGLETSTVNLIDSATLTTGYWLVANVPTVKENYFYSDYIKIGDIPFCYRDQGASISYLVSCYDAEKTYLGAVDYSTNGYERITGTLPTGYYKITPKKGTVYIRVNGRYQSNLMLCPYFYPEKYIAYGKVYYKGALKCAMFGDSITLGTNGDDHSTPVTENLPYWVEKITGMIVDNYGVGSMGWVSTQYYTDIAYDKISSIDLTGYDVITLCYGVNDTGAVLGSYDSTDDTTIMGQINKCVKYIGGQNPKARIIIIAPWNGASSSATFPAWGYGRTVYYAASGDASRTKTRKDLSDTESELCGVYGCGFVSQIDSPLNGFGLGQADGTTPGPYIGADLVHPSIAGYKAMGEWLSAKINSIVAFK